MTKWNFIDDIRPKRRGLYLVVWSEPYYDKPRIDSCYYYYNSDHPNVEGRFTNEHHSGANEIIYWAELPDLPEIDKKLRQRKVEK